MAQQELFGKSIEDLVCERQKELEIVEEEARKKREEEQAQKNIIYEKLEQLANVTGPKDIVAAITALTQLPEFNTIYREFNSIPDVIDKIKYIDRVIYEKMENYCHVFNDPQTNLGFHKSLTDIGLPLLCPYLKIDDANKTTHQDCTIDSEEIMSICDGRNDICVIFKDRMMKAAQGLINIKLPAVISGYASNQECMVDLEDLDDWWKSEGKYE